MTGARVDYVLPLRWTDDAGLPELTAYLAGLPADVRPIVVDGSPEGLFAAHARAWRELAVHHLRPAVACRNGKVAGVLTGVRAGDARAVVIADDDIRYDAAGLRRVVGALIDADLVGPQNVLRPTPWHARWDTARTLLNRALGADYPGTFAVRRSTFEAMGGYAGDVLFENLELMRTVEAWGGTVVRPLDLYVERRPPTARHFVRQRVRQAYDDLAQPGRLAAELAIVPAVLAVGAVRPRGLLGVAAAAVAVAEVGRRRAGGRDVFPAAASAYAPLWLLERGTCIWAAVVVRVTRGGVAYAGQRLQVAAHSPRELRRRRERLRAVLAGQPLLDPVRGVPGEELRSDVGAVAERLDRRPPAPAQGHGLTTGVDPDAVVVDELDVAADDQRTVAVGGHPRRSPSTL